MSPARKTPRRWRSIHITALGRQILEAIDAGTYRFATAADIARRNIARVNARRAKA